MLAVLLCSGVAFPGVAQAGEEESKTFFAEGRKLREAGKCAEAIDAFRRALEAWPEGIGALRNIAECQEELGQYASARRSFWDLRRAAMQNDDAKYDRWEDTADAAYTRMEPLVPRLTLKIVGADPTKLRVRLDGEELTRNSIGVPLERDVGIHKVEVWHKDKLMKKRSVQLDASQSEVLTLDIALPVEKVPPVGGPGKIEEPSIVLEAVGWATLSVGVLGLGGAIASAVVRGGAISDLEDGCPGFDESITSQCPPEMQDALDRGETASTLFNVFGVVAIVGIGAGIPMIVVGTLEDGGEASVSIVPVPGGAAWMGRLRY
jgi:hypothetical protein